MKKEISSFGSVLNKEEQKTIKGGIEDAAVACPAGMRWAMDISTGATGCVFSDGQ